MLKYIRNCPVCQAEIAYVYEKFMKNGEDQKIPCRKCQSEIYRQKEKGKKYTRKCPTCSALIYYVCKGGMDIAERANSECKKCALSGEKNPMYGKTGELASFWGRHHTEECKERFSQSRSGIPLKPEHKVKVLAGLKKTQEKNKKEGNLSPYQHWVAKHGKEMADTKEAEWKEKLSEAFSGKKNPMYGKPSPTGSGNGWKGWYKGFFFRSLREVSYLTYLDEKKIPWESAEKKCWSIPYFDPVTNNMRTYRADFLVNKKMLIEIKPIKLHQSITITAKRDAAMEFCKKNGMGIQIDRLRY